MLVLDNLNASTIDKIVREHFLRRTEDDTHVIPLADFLGDVQERLVVEIELTILPSGIYLGIYSVNGQEAALQRGILTWLQTLGHRRLG